MSKALTDLQGMEPKPRPVSLFNPFGRLDTSRKARRAAQLGVVPAVFIGLGYVYDLARVGVIVTRWPQSQWRLRPVDGLIDLVAIAILTCAGIALLRTQAVWAARVVLGVTIFTVLARFLAGGLIGMISYNFVSMILAAIICFRGANALQRMGGDPLVQAECF